MSQDLNQIPKDLYLNLVGVIIVALNKNGEIIVLNRKGYEVLEYNTGELTGKNWFEQCIPNLFKDQVLGIFKKIMEGEIEPLEFFENPVVTKFGNKKIIAWHNTVLYDTNNNIIGTLSSGEDITERKKAEKQLKDQRAALESIFKAAPIGIGVVVNRVFTQVNDRFCDLVGYSRDELLGKNARIVYPTNEDYEYVGRIKYSKIQKHGIGTVETRFRRKDGKILDILLSSAPINPPDLTKGVTFTALDITKRKKVEKYLKDSEEKYRLLAENLNDLISVINNKGCIEYINERTHKKVMGYSYKDLMHKPVFELIHPEDKEKVIQEFKNTFKYGEGFVEARIIHKDGYFIWTETNGKVFLDSDGKIKILTITRDISERKKIEIALRQSEEEYRRAYNQSNFYKDVFTHDINNILQIILSSVELVKLFSSDLEQKKPLEESINHIYDQVIRGKMLVKNIQELSKTSDSTSNLFLIEIVKVLEDSIKSIKNQFNKKQVEIEIQSDNKNYLVMANDLLRDVFENIISNAIRHNINPLIQISIKISRKYYNESKFIKIEFLDNGQGIPDSMKHSIFNRQYKREKIPSGIGLGLLLVKKILKTYKAEIKVEDRVKGDCTKGSNFIIKIPESI
ncbi:MAG: PAS domain S-box protein [Promethearchaeota archaeon]